MYVVFFFLLLLIYTHPIANMYTITFEIILIGLMLKIVLLKTHWVDNCHNEFVLGTFKFLIVLR